MPKETKRNQRLLYSEDFDTFFQCPAAHIDHRRGAFDLGPYRSLKAAVDRVLMAIPPTPSRKWPKLFDDYLALTDYDRIAFYNNLNWLYLRRTSLLAVNGRTPMAIGGEPVSVYIPYVYRLTHKVNFVWPDFYGRQWDRAKLYEHPSICAIWLSMWSEGRLDQHATYYATIINGITEYTLKKTKKEIDTIREYMATLVRGYSNVKEVKTPSEACLTCDSRNNCAPGQIRISRNTDKALPFLSRGQDR